jgi:hypothetical protein
MGFQQTGNQQVVNRNVPGAGAGDDLYKQGQEQAKQWQEQEKAQRGAA